MLKIAICEDCKIQRENFKEYLHKVIKYHNIEYQVVEFDSGEDLLSEYPSNLDILLLDIQMGEMNGMDVARKLRAFDSKVEIIFTTATIDYIQEGYEVRAYRYLLKPIDYDTFKQQINSCLSDITNKKDNYLVISQKNNINRIQISSILFIETKIGKRELIVYTNDGIQYIKTTMTKIEKELEKHNFVRCHSGYMVNLFEIEALNQGIISIKNHQIPVSKRKIKEVKEKLTNVLGDVLC
ncbi:MAG: LytR/AlgR family response regulator transcription factor [Peptostreptococcaceae bacterium]